MFHLELLTRRFNFHFFTIELLTPGLKNQNFPLKLPARWVNFYIFIFFLSSVIEWNNLDNDITNSESIEAF